MYIVDSDEDFEKYGIRCEGEAEWFVAFLNQINEEGSAMRFKTYAIDMMKKEITAAAKEKKKREALG